MEEYEDYERPYACDWEGCDQRFKYKRHLIRHKECTHENSLKFPCTVSNCKKVFDRKYHLERHLNIHNKDLDGIGECGGSDKVTKKQKPKRKKKYGPRQYRCDWVGCDVVLHRSHLMIKHKAKHLGTFKCLVEGCDYMAGCAKHLMTHQLIHTEDRPYKCEHCDKCFKDEFNVQNHVRLMHPQECHDIAYHECDHEGCQYKTKALHRMNSHKQIHSRPFSCETCGNRFGRKAHLDVHVFTHSETKSFECSHCSKTFKSPSHLKRHILVLHKPKTIICDFTGCGKKFSTRFALNMHAKGHTNKFVCEWPGCENSYTTKLRLKFHTNMHKGLKPYKCEWPGCDKAYADRNVLSVHSKRHKGEHVYSCQTEGCDFKCDHWLQLKKHDKTHLDN